MQRTGQCVLFRRNYLFSVRHSVKFSQYDVQDLHAELRHGFVHDNLQLLLFWIHRQRPTACTLQCF
jgi:hypothetical protein